MAVNDNLQVLAALHPDKSPQSVPTKLETGYEPERAYKISNTALPTIPAETEIRLRLSFGQQA